MSSSTIARQIQRQREHQYDLIRDLLGGQGSPFTLVLDSLSQSAKPFIIERLRNLDVKSSQTIYVSFETTRKPRFATHFIPAFNLNPKTLQQEITNLTQPPAAQALTSLRRRSLIIIDSLHSLLSDSSINVSNFLSSFITPGVCLLTVYHIDQPLLQDFSSNSKYRAPPLKLLRYLATTIIETHALQHLLLAKAARQRSLAAPPFGLAEDVEGVIQALNSNGRSGTTVFTAQIRRKSGRAEELTFVLGASTSAAAGKGVTRFLLLDEHPSYRDPVTDNKGSDDHDDVGQVTSFKLGLTEKERRDRDGVVLPYFDAQNEFGAPGEGGRILYDMGEEDDFDEEEDEI